MVSELKQSFKNVTTHIQQLGVNKGLDAERMNSFASGLNSSIDAVSGFETNFSNGYMQYIRENPQALRTSTISDFDRMASRFSRSDVPIIGNVNEYLSKVENGLKLLDPSKVSEFKKETQSMLEELAEENKMPVNDVLNADKTKFRTQLLEHLDKFQTSAMFQIFGLSCQQLEGEFMGKNAWYWKFRTICMGKYK